MGRFAVVMLALVIGACGGSSNTGGGPVAPPPPPAGPAIPPGVSPLVATMFGELPGQIQSALADNQATLPNNPQIAAFISAKITMLQRPGLAVEISDGRRFVEATVASSNGRSITIAALFVEERHRVDAQEAVEELRRGLPILEQFLATPFPGTEIRMWYGFKVGNSGGGGVLHMEDRTSYESRTPSTRLPFDAILAHELSHTYIGNETLNQFLELYVFNRVRGAGADLGSWGFTRGYLGVSESNVDSALVLDVYQLLGHDAMARAYKAAYPLRPPYGERLSVAVIQAFTNEATDSAKSQVSAKLSRVTF